MIYAWNNVVQMITYTIYTNDSFGTYVLEWQFRIFTKLSLLAALIWLPFVKTMIWYYNFRCRQWATVGQNGYIFFISVSNYSIARSHSRPSLPWHYNERNGVSNRQPHGCLLNRFIQWASKLHVTDLCEGNSPVTGEFPAQRASNVENVSICGRHHDSEQIWRWQSSLSFVKEHLRVSFHSRSQLMAP